MLDSKLSHLSGFVLLISPWQQSQRQWSICSISAPSCKWCNDPAGFHLVACKQAAMDQQVRIHKTGRAGADMSHSRDHKEQETLTQIPPARRCQKSGLGLLEKEVSRST